MPPHAGTTMARRQLGRRLRSLRVEAGKTLDDVAESRIASLTKMWRIETGQSAIKQGDVLALARLYAADPSVTDAMLTLADATRGTGYQQDRLAGVPDWDGIYGDLEAAASITREYSTHLVPGLLQTPDYARTVIAVNHSYDAATVEQRVAFRLRRQRIVFERAEPGRLDLVLTAGVLGLIVGSPEIMTAQITHLRAMSAWNEVTVRVLTAANGVHAGMRGDFAIMDFPDEDDPPLVYLESLIGSRYLERPEHLAAYREVFDQISTQAVPLEEYDP